MYALAITVVVRSKDEPPSPEAVMRDWLGPVHGVVESNGFEHGGLCARMVDLADEASVAMVAQLSGQGAPAVLFAAERGESCICVREVVLDGALQRAKAALDN